MAGSGLQNTDEWVHWHRHWWYNLTDDIYDDDNDDEAVLMTKIMTFLMKRTCDVIQRLNIMCLSEKLLRWLQCWCFDDNDNSNGDDNDYKCCNLSAATSGWERSSWDCQRLRGLVTSRRGFWDLRSHIFRLVVGIGWYCLGLVGIGCSIGWDWLVVLGLEESYLQVGRTIVWCLLRILSANHFIVKTICEENKSIL